LIGLNFGWLTTPAGQLPAPPVKIATLCSGNLVLGHAFFGQQASSVNFSHLQGPCDSESLRNDEIQNEHGTSNVFLNVNQISITFSKRNETNK